MKRRLAIFVFFFICISGSLKAQTPAAVIPDFTFFTLDGVPYSSKSIPGGKPILFSFFDVTCPHCQTTMKTFAAHSAELKGISVFLVTLDGKDAVNNFMNTYGSGLSGLRNLVILEDVNHEFIPKFQPTKYPSVFLYNKNKKLEVYENDEKRVINVLDKIKTLK